VERAGDVLSPRELIARGWSGLVVDEANVRVNIASLRKCLGEGKDGARYIVNLPGRGYTFVAPVSRVSSESPSSNLQVNGPTAFTAPGHPPASNSGCPSTSALALPQRLERLIGRDVSVQMLVE